MDRNILAYVRHQIVYSFHDVLLYRVGSPVKNLTFPTDTSQIIGRIAYSMMYQFKTHCGSPSCISGHTSFILTKFESLTDEDRSHFFDEFNLARSILDLSEKQAKFLFTPEIEGIADYTVSEGYSGFIPKDLVICCLDNVIAGQNNIEKAWREAYKKLKEERPYLFDGEKFILRY